MDDVTTALVELPDVDSIAVVVLEASNALILLYHST